MTDDKPMESTNVKSKPFPWRCPTCRKWEVEPAIISYSLGVNHDGRVYEITLPNFEVPQCRSCGELLFDNNTGEQISVALRSHLHLLSPEQIRGGRTALRLIQRTLAERLGVAEATLSRWETGAMIQSRAMDNLLRAYFELPEVRAVLTGPEQDPALGTVPVFK